MNAKTSNQKTKNSPRVANRAAPAKRIVRKPGSAGPVSGKARKSAATRRGKVTPSPAAATSQVQSDPAAPSKQARLIAMLEATPGATLSQMMALTGWQAHTVRGMISGALRKKLGLNVTCVPAGDSGARVYRIVGTAAAA